LSSPLSKIEFCIDFPFKTQKSLTSFFISIFNLQACSSEVMMLRTARRYDIHTDSIVFANNQPYTKEKYASSGLSGVPDTLFPFCRYLCLMKVDNAEYALLTAIVVFSGKYN
jgi:ecdysone receptor